MVRRATVFLAKGMALSLCVVLGVLMGTAGREVPAGASGGGAAQCMNGDVDGDGKRNLGDVIYLLRYVFQIPGAPEPVACADGEGLTPEQAEILGHMSIVQLDDGQGGTAKTIRISGANLQIVNGLGATNGNPDDPGSWDETNVDGLGNLIVGYQEFRGDGNDRTGSHNIVVGKYQDYSSFGGLVAGWHNTISDVYACVTGGARNTASGAWASVSGGRDNIASGTLASVSGGDMNTASGSWASVSGGRNNKASGQCSFVGGGGGLTAPEGNEAFSDYAAILGGAFNQASGVAATVSGGQINIASGDWASVSGGEGNVASEWSASVSGGGGNTASGAWASVGGNCGITMSNECGFAP